MQCILYLIHFTLCKEMSFISLHTSHYPVPESSMLNVKRGWRDNKNYKVFWFYAWVYKCVYKSKVKIYKNRKQIFSNIFSGLKTSSQSIRNYQQCPAPSSPQIEAYWFSTGAKTHLCTIQKYLTRVNIY